MGQTRTVRWVGLLAVAWLPLGDTSGGAAAYSLHATAKAQASRTSLGEENGAASGQRVEQVPLRSGVWEQSVSADKLLVDGPSESFLCPGTLAWYFFPSIPAGKYGKILPEEVMSADSVERLADGRYRVTGGERTARGGDVGCVHLITLHGDGAYEDALTLTSHETTHPVKATYTGRGHWVRPCAAQGK